MPASETPRSENETMWKIVPHDDFTNLLVPGEDLPAYYPFPSLEVDLDHDEIASYDSFRKGLNSHLEAVGWTDYEALSTHSHADTSAAGPQLSAHRNSTRPDLGIYPKQRPRDWLVHDPSTQVEAEAASGAESTQHPQSSTSGVMGDEDEVHPAPVSATARVSWAWAELLVEVKVSKKPVSKSLHPVPEAQERGQIVDYAVGAMYRQHRTFFFMISIHNDTAAFLRFDRSGIIASTRFSYVQHPEIIGNFLYRLSRLDRQRRGYDPTVTLASEEEASTFCALSSQFPDNYTVRTALEHASTIGWPIYKLTVFGPFSLDEHGKMQGVSRRSPSSSRQFLVGRPVNSPRSLVGRGTRGFVAYDVVSHQVVFIKDSGRPDLPGVRAEHDTYLLIRERVPEDYQINFPTLLGGGDVLSGPGGTVQRTLAVEDYLGAAGTTYIHFRLVLKEVCRPLVQFSNSWQLLKAVSNAVTAHRLAWRHCQLLHHDISVGNILIYDETNDPDSMDVKGLLGDWDLAEEEGCGAEQLVRSGTWTFMSARLKRFPWPPHHLADDLESFVHVLNWCALLYLPHQLSADRDWVAFRVQEVYERYQIATLENGEKLEVGGRTALDYIRSGERFVELHSNNPLSEIMQPLSDLLREHYRHVLIPEDAIVSMHAPADGIWEVINDYNASEDIPLENDDDEPATNVNSDVIILNTPETDKPICPTQQYGSVASTQSPSPLRNHTKMEKILRATLYKKRAWAVHDRLEFPRPANPPGTASDSMSSRGIVIHDLRRTFGEARRGEPADQGMEPLPHTSTTSTSPSRSPAEDTISHMKASDPFGDAPWRSGDASLLQQSSRLYDSVNHLVATERSSSTSPPNPSHMPMSDSDMSESQVHRSLLQSQRPQPVVTQRGHHYLDYAPGTSISMRQHPLYVMEHMAMALQLKPDAQHATVGQGHSPSPHEHIDVPHSAYPYDSGLSGRSRTPSSRSWIAVEANMFQPVMSQRYSTMPSPGEKRAPLTGTSEPPMCTTTHSSAAYWDDSRVVNTPHNPLPYASASSGRQVPGDQWPTAQAHPHASPMVSGVSYLAMNPPYYAESDMAPCGQVQPSASGSHLTVAPMPNWHDPVAGHETYHAGRQDRNDYSSAAEQWVQGQEYGQEYGPPGSHAPDCSAGNWQYGGGSR